jgi:serine/threonine protein kinase
MGAVHEGRHHGTGEVVALKVLIGLMDERAVERFLAEAAAAARVSHANVVRVAGSGRDGGRPWIAFELVPGGSLRDRLRKGGALPWHEAARTAAEVATGLAAIHVAGLVHRDLKPENVLLAEDGTAKVSDLGLVRSQASDLTKTGELLGTLAYMAPEQVEDPRQAEARSDLYALGVVLFEMLAGRLPFTEQGLALAKAHLMKPPPPLHELAPRAPKGLVALVEHLLSKAPVARPASAEDVAAELALLIAGRHERSRLPLAIALLAALGVGGGALVAFAKRPVRGAVPSAPLPPPPVPSPTPRRPTPPPAPSVVDERVLVSSDPAEEALVRRAETLFDEGDQGAALAAYDEAVRVHPEWLRIRFRRGERRIHAGKARDAIADLDAVIAAFPELLRATMLRGYARRVTGDLEGARVDYDFVLERAPDEPEFRMHDADFRLETREYERTIEDVNRVLDRAPPNVRPALVRSRADANYKLHRYFEAIPDYEEARKSAPENTDILYHLLQSLDADKERESHRYRHPDQVKEVATALLRLGGALRGNWLEDAYLARSEAHAALGELEGARDDLRKALDYETRPETIAWLKERIAQVEGVLRQKK